MASKFAWWCANFPKLWIILTVQEVCALPRLFRNPFQQETETKFDKVKNSWPTYNGVPQYPNYLPSPYNYFPGAPYFGNAQWQNLPDFQRNQYNQWTFPQGWINNKFVKAPGSPQKPPTKTQAHQKQEQNTTTTTDNPKTIFDQDEITKRIEEALRNGELLYTDEWLERQNKLSIQKRSRPRPNRKERRNTTEEHEENRDDNHLGTATVCGGSTFCVNVTDYPERLVNLAMQRNDSLKLLAKNDEVPEINQRLDDMDAVPLCRSHMQVVYPRSAESVDRDWLFVVNQKNFKQGVRIEMCLTEGSDCGGLSDFIPEGYSVTCKQTYIHRELAAVLPNGIIDMRTFKFPASCCCHRVIKDIYDNFI